MRARNTAWTSAGQTGFGADRSSAARPEPAVLVTVDVEEDMPRWVVEPKIRATNAASLPRLQRLCDRLEIPPTYLLTYPMATLPESRRILETLVEAGRCELGAHLHAWNTPPLPDGPEQEARRATELPRALMRARLKHLTSTLRSTFGEPPTSFRSGRFGLDEAVVAVLEEEGYEVDSSVTSGLDWQDEGGVNFSGAPRHPYFLDRHNLLRAGGGAILEVPVSVGFTRSIPSWLGAVYHRIPRWTRLRGLLSTEYSGLLDYHWLSPARRSTRSLLQVADTLLEEGAPVINIFFHSSEIHPGTSIYHRTEADVEGYFAVLEALLEHLVRRCGLRGLTLTGYARAWRRWNPPLDPSQRCEPKLKESVA